MRVIGGEFRSRRLQSMPGLEVRPTPDRLREALFNVLQTRIADSLFVDAYAGTGAVGIEALSRGAREAVFIERSRKAANLIRENLETLGALNRARVIQGTAGAYAAAQKADILFLDPPYTKPEEYKTALREIGEAAPELVIVQHATRQILEDSYGSLRRTRVLRQGDNSLSFYEPVK